MPASYSKHARATNKNTSFWISGRSGKVGDNEKEGGKVYNTVVAYNSSDQLLLHAKRNSHKTANDVVPNK